MIKSAIKSVLQGKLHNRKPLNKAKAKTLRNRPNTINDLQTPREDYNGGENYDGENSDIFNYDQTV